MSPARASENGGKRGESLALALAVQALGVVVHDKQDAPVGRERQAGDDRRGAAARPASAVHHESAVLKQARAQSRAGAALQQGGVGVRVERQIFQPPQRRRDGQRQLSAGTKSGMRGDRLVNGEMMGRTRRQGRLGFSQKASRAFGFGAFHESLVGPLQREPCPWAADRQTKSAKIAAEAAVHVEKAQVQARRGRDANFVDARLGRHDAPFRSSKTSKREFAARLGVASPYITRWRRLVATATPLRE